MRFEVSTAIGSQRVDLIRDRALASSLSHALYVESPFSLAETFARSAAKAIFIICRTSIENICCASVIAETVAVNPSSTIRVGAYHQLICQLPSCPIWINTTCRLFVGWIAVDHFFTRSLEPVHPAQFGPPNWISGYGIKTMENPCVSFSLYVLDILELVACERHIETKEFVGERNTVHLNSFIAVSFLFAKGQRK